MGWQFFCDHVSRLDYSLHPRENIHKAFTYWCIPLYCFMNEPMCVIYVLNKFVLCIQSGGWSVDKLLICIQVCDWSVDNFLICIQVGGRSVDEGGVGDSREIWMCHDILQWYLWVHCSVSQQHTPSGENIIKRGKHTASIQYYRNGAYTSHSS